MIAVCLLAGLSECQVGDEGSQTQITEVKPEDLVVDTRVVEEEVEPDSSECIFPQISIKLYDNNVFTLREEEIKKKKSVTYFVKPFIFQRKWNLIQVSAFFLRFLFTSHFVMYILL